MRGGNSHFFWTGGKDGGIAVDIDMRLGAGDSSTFDSFNDVQGEAAVGTKEMCELAREPKESSDDLEQEKLLKHSPLHVRGRKANCPMGPKLGICWADVQKGI